MCSDSDTKNGFSQLTVGIETSFFNMIWLFMSPSLCKNLVEIGPVVSEIFDQMCLAVVVGVDLSIMVDLSSSNHRKLHGVIF